VKLQYTAEEIETWRDRRHRRTPRLAVRTTRKALGFINEVGFCFAFKAVNSELPCLWHAACGERDPVMPRRTHHDPFVSFVWEVKNVLPAQRLVYYGRVLKHRPTLVSMALFPYFYALTKRTGMRDDYLRVFRHGQLSPVAKAIMDALVDSSPQVTKGLKLAVGRHSVRDRAGFDRAMVELQMKMFIVKTAEHYDPFTFEWEMVPRAFPSEIRKARRISVQEARSKILEHYFRNQLVGSVPAICRLFGWEKQAVFQTLGMLVNKGVITPEVTVDGKRSTAYCLIA
jgi:hypothetical protein